MRVALLGAGRIGSAHAATLRRLVGIDELLIADVDPDRARRAADTSAAGDVTEVRATSIDDAFARRPGAVVIAAPTPAHAELILRAAGAGIPTFCEKPLAGSLASTVEVVEQVEGLGATVQVGFQRRFDEGYRSARAALRAGSIGQLRRAHLLTCDPSPPPAEYIRTSGGIYRDCHVHDFDILRWVTGQEVEWVFATGSNRGADFFAAADDVDESSALLELDDGTLVTLQGSRYNGAGYDVRMELAGTEGSRSVGLDARSPMVSAEPDTDFPGGPPWRNFQERFAAAYETELAAFLDVAAGTIDSPCTPRDALEALYVAEAADLSRREGRVVHLQELRG